MLQRRALAQDDHANGCFTLCFGSYLQAWRNLHLSDVMDLNLEATRSSGEQYGGYDVEALVELTKSATRQKKN